MIHDYRTMSFRELAVFVEVVRCGSITAAADKLDMAKSAVSTTLARLEARLQIKLLNRSARRMALTREGAQLLPRVESLLAEGKRLLSDAHVSQGAPQGTVRLAVTPDVGSQILAELVPALRAVHPDIRLIGNMALTQEDLQDPSFDLAIRIGAIRDDRLVAKPLGSFRRIALASPAFCAQHPIQHPRELEDLPLLVFSDQALERQWRFVSRNGEPCVIEARGAFAANSFKLLIPLSAAGNGVCNVPDLLAQPMLNRGELQRILPDWASPPAPLHLLFRPGSQHIQRVRAVMDVIENTVPGLLVSDGWGA